jgi:organic radical activating enzyme
MAVKSVSAATLEQLKQSGLPVVIFGSGIVGEALFHSCQEIGIRVECFCDNNINKTHALKCQRPVVFAGDLKKKFPDAWFLVSAADIKDVVDQLRGMGYSKWLPCGVFLRDFVASRYPLDAPEDFVDFAVGTCVLCHDSYMTPDKLFLRSVDVIITERCSLRCRDCSNLMQYYKKPMDIPAAEVNAWIDAFCLLVDEINEFRVIGGEPFINKEFPLIVSRLVAEPKVKRVVIYTNGTLIPNDAQFESLMHAKVILMVTDYGVLARKLQGLEEKLRQHKVSYYVRKAQGWTACSRIQRHHRSDEEQTAVFRRCCARNLVTLSDGRLFRCPFAANAERLHAIQSSKGDSVSLLPVPVGSEDRQALKRTIRAYLMDKPFLAACDYCDGRPFDAPEIAPAVQTAKPLDYEHFEQT